MELAGIINIRPMYIVIKCQKGKGLTSAKKIYSIDSGIYANSIFGGFGSKIKLYRLYLIR